MKAISIQSHTLNSEVSKLGCWKQVEEKKREGNQSLWNRARKKQRPLRLREKTMIQVAKGTGAGNCFNTAAQSERRRRMGWLVLPFTDSMNHMPKEHTAAHPPWAMLGQAFPGLGNYRQIQKHSIRYSVIQYASLQTCHPVFLSAFHCFNCNLVVFLECIKPEI